MQFKDVVGQERIKEKLIQTVRQNRVSHAQLFLGPEGCGNLPMALAYATYINCLNRGESDSCNECSSCVKYNKLIHPDLHFVFPVNTNKSVKKDPKSDDYLSSWREFVIGNPYFHEAQWYDQIEIENKQGFIGVDDSSLVLRKLSFKPYESDYKIMIMWLPEKMNAPAANKLLKIIEEPPEKTIILMVSETTDGILPTVLSRVQVVKFQGIEEALLEKIVKEKYKLSGDELADLVHLSTGNYLKVMDTIESNEENSFFLDRFSAFMRVTYQDDIQKLLYLSDEFAALGRERQKRYLEYALGLIRENMVMNFKKKEIIYMNKAESAFSEKFHPFVNPGKAPFIYELLNKALRDIEANGYAKIIFTDVGLKMYSALRRE